MGPFLIVTLLGLILFSRKAVTAILGGGVILLLLGMLKMAEVLRLLGH